MTVIHVTINSKGMTSSHCVAGDLHKCEQPFCLIITVYTKEQEYKKNRSAKKEAIMLSQEGCLEMEIENWLGNGRQSELKQLT